MCLCVRNLIQYTEHVNVSITDNLHKNIATESARQIKEIQGNTILFSLTSIKIGWNENTVYLTCMIMPYTVPQV